MVSCARAEPARDAVGTEADIRIATFAFEPSTLHVRVGDAVIWRNEDDILHTVTSGLPKRQGVPGVSEDRPARPDGLLDRDLELNDTFNFEFEQAGTFSYYCDIHSGMRGKVVVTE